MTDVATVSAVLLNARGFVPVAGKDFVINIREMKQESVKPARRKE